MTVPTISSFPTPIPSRTQTPAVFNPAMNAFLAHLPDFVSDANAAGSAINTAVTDAEAAALDAQNAVPFATWTALAAATGMSAGDRATVIASDTGTHTDPVVGGTVANAGIYTYSDDPAGWERIASLDSALAAAQVTLATAEKVAAQDAAGIAAGAVNFQGAYDEETLYAVGESVTYEGGVFLKITTAAAGTTPVDGVDWLELSGGFTLREVFTSSDTWSKQPGALFHDVFLISGGGGGGSGRRGAAGTTRNGGGGGGGGAMAMFRINSEDLPSTVSVTVGAGGAGGAAVTADDTDGNAGGAGGATSFGSFVRVGPSGGGAGGGGAAFNAGGAAAVGQTSGLAGGASQTAGAGHLAGTSVAATGGGGGGGLSNGNVASAGAAGGSMTAYSGDAQNSAGATAGNNAVAATVPAAGVYGPGLGGGGGGANGGRGANGSGFGGGGGGGGASANGTNSGAGGNGAPGLVIVTTYF